MTNKAIITEFLILDITCQNSKTINRFVVNLTLWHFGNYPQNLLDILQLLPRCLHSYTEDGAAPVFLIFYIFTIWHFGNLPKFSYAIFIRLVRNKLGFKQEIMNN